MQLNFPSQNPQKQPAKSSGFNYSSPNDGTKYANLPLKTNFLTDEYADEVFEEIEESHEDYFKSSKEKKVN